MAVSHEWNGVVFDVAVNMLKNEQVHNEVVNQYPGSPGVEVINLDNRTRVVVIAGVMESATASGLTTALDAIDDMYNTTATLNLDGGGTSYENCKCRLTRGRRWASANGYSQEYTATFTQLYPNA